MMNQKPTRILLIEDNPGDARWIQEMLTEAGGGFVIEHADHLSDGLTRLAKGGIDLTLLDLSLPDSHGLDTLVKAQAATPEMPIILLTGFDDDALAVQAVQAGAQDYLVKGQFDRRLLQRAIRYALERHQLVEQVRTEKALRQLETEYRNLVDNALVGVYKSNLAGDILYANEAIARIFEFETPEEYIAAGAGARYKNPEDRTAFIKQLKQTGRISNIELEEVTKTGAIRHVLVSAVLDGEVLEGMVMDVTEHRQAGQAGRENEERYRFLYNNTPGMLHSIDRNGRLVSVNNYWLNVLGYERDEVIGRHVTEFLTEASRRYAEEVTLPEFFRTGIAKDVPYQFVKKNGEVIDILLSAIAERNAAGEVKRTLTVLNDITERKKTEEALRNTKEQLQAIINNTPLVLFALDNQGVFTLSEGKGLELLGRKSGQVVGQSIFELYSDQPKILESVRRAFDGQACSLSVEVAGLTFDAWYEPIHNQDGQVAGVVGVAQDITERKRAEEALKQSEEEYRALYEKAPIAYYSVSTEGHILRANLHTAAMSGYAVDDLIGRKILDLYADTPDGKEKAEKVFQRFRAGEEVRGEELEWRTADGRSVWISITVQPARDAEGRIVASRAMAVDITERKQAEQALQEEKALLDALMENSLDSIYFKDRQCRLTRISRKLMDDLKLTDMSQVLGKTDVDLFGREFGMETLAHEQKIMATGRPVVGLIESRTLENGETNWTMTTKVPLRNAGGQITGLVGVTREINDIKQTMDVLRKFSRAIEQTASAIVIMNHQGIVEFVNPAFTKINGYTYEETVGKTLETITSGNHSPEFYENLWTTVTQGDVWTGEVQNKKKNGELVWEYATISPIKDEDGKISHYVSILEDITQRKLMENELHQAKEVAEAATRAKSEFLANMSHEIRTPMNGVIGMTSLLLDTNLTPEQRDFVEVIRTSGDSLLTIINDILDFSKIEADKLELECSPFALGNCIEEALDLVASKAAEKGLELAYLVEDNLPEMFGGDVTRLRQILVNLLGNAVKFTDTGEVVVSVTGHNLSLPSSPLQTKETEERYELQFAVKDTGIGISNDQMNLLFKSFSQADTSITRRFGGTGLGLAISKRLSEMMGGMMWVKSEVGVGSTFYFTISVKATTQPKQSLGHIASSHLAGKRLLIVDDSETNRRIISHHVDSWGMAPVVTASGLQALELMQQGEHFDLAILDMQMPDMDGLTLATEIRNLESSDVKGSLEHNQSAQNSTLELPLIMLSSMGRQRDKQDHFAAHLTKPVKPSHLHNVLAEILMGEPIKVKKPSSQPQLDQGMGQNHPLQILLAEDNVVNQKVALTILERLGYRADVAANGFEVLEALERQPYDMVLMDIQMPEMDGLTATQQIRQQLTEAHQPWIIAMTANVLEGDREKYLAAGMDNHIGKPVQVGELITVLSQCQPLLSQSENLKSTSETSTSTLATTSNTEQNVENSNSPVTTPALDITALEQFQAQFGADTPELMCEFINIFLKNAPEILDQLQESLTKGDAKTLHRAAHTLKSNSATFGASNLSALCAELEKCAKAGSLAGVDIMLVNIREEFKRVQTELIHYSEVFLV